LIGFWGVPIDKPSDVVDDPPPHAARSEPPTVIPPVVIASFRRKSRLCIGLKFEVVMS